MVKGASFSIGQALASGLRLPVRHPWAVTLWGLLLTLAGLLGTLLLLPMLSGIALPEMADERSLEAFGSSLIMVQAASNGLSLVNAGLSLLVWAAAMRATLRIGRSDRWAFLRIGMDELRVAVVMVAIMIGLYIALLVLIALGAALGFALHDLGLTAVLFGLAVYGLVVIILLVLAWSRLSLLAPLCVVLGTFAFVEGWQLGRGQTLRLAGLNLLVWLICLLALVLVGLLVGAILVGGFFASGVRWPMDPRTPGDIFAAFAPMSGWIGLSLLPLAAYTGWSIAFVAGALTSAARQLADGPPAEIIRPG